MLGARRESGSGGKRQYEIPHNPPEGAPLFFFSLGRCRRVFHLPTFLLNEAGSGDGPAGAWGPECNEKSIIIPPSSPSIFFLLILFFLVLVIVVVSTFHLPFFWKTGRIGRGPGDRARWAGTDAF